MTTIPTWLAASAGEAGQAGHTTQFLTTHETQYIYSGDFVDGDLSDGGSATSTNGTWLAQSFATGTHTSVGSIVGSIRTASTNPALLAPTTLSVYADDGGAPTGDPLVTLTFPLEFVTGGALDDAFTYPLPVTGLTVSTVYWLVTPAAGNSTDHYNWYRSGSASGASTSTDGVTWTAQSYGFQVQVYDQTVIAPLYCTWEDDGQRWTTSEPGGANGEVGRYSEYTVGQTTSGYLFSQRTFAYTAGLPTGVT